MRRKTTLVAVAVVLSLFFFASQALAYVTNGQKWPGSNASATWYLDSSVPSGWSSAIAAGASEWNHVTLFTFVQLGSSNPVLGSDLGDISSGAPLARSAWWYDTQTGIISSAQTVFNTSTSIKWSTSGASDSFDVQTAAAHELGHWLSLGHSSDTTAVMYAYLDYGQTKHSLTSDDQAGIKAIYENP